VAYAAWTWVPIFSDRDSITLGWHKPDRPRRLRLFADAYGLIPRDRHRLVRTIRKRIVDHVEGIRRLANAGEPAFVRIVRRGTSAGPCATCGSSITSATPSSTPCGSSPAAACSGRTARSSRLQRWAPPARSVCADGNEDRHDGVRGVLSAELRSHCGPAPRLSRDHAEAQDITQEAFCRASIDGRP
jgi:hypothetical protein